MWCGGGGGRFISLLILGFLIADGGEHGHQCTYNLWSRVYRSTFIEFL